MFGENRLGRLGHQTDISNPDWPEPSRQIGVFLYVGAHT